MAFQNRNAGTPRAPCRNDGERNRGQHEDNGGNRGRLRQQGRRTARAERRLRPHAAESPGQISSFAALQQHHDDQEKTNHDVNEYEET